MAKEIWRPICGGYYEIMRNGTIRRLKPGRGTWVGRMLLPFYPDATGDELYVILQCNGKKREVKVSDLVKEAWESGNSND